MKALVIFTIAIICVGAVWVSFQELYSENRVLKSEVKGLRIQIDSLKLLKPCQ